MLFVPDTVTSSLRFQGNARMKSMMRVVLVCVGLLSASSQAQAIYKCVVHGAITYQEEPCPMLQATKGVSRNTLLVGKWTYDHDVTMAWMKGHDTMTKREEAALNALAGHLTYTFTTNLLSEDRKAYDVVVDGTVQEHMEAIEETTPYTIVSANSKLVSISVQNPDTLSGYASELHFEGPDTMWRSEANQRLTAIDHPNARIYYKRVH